MPTKRTFDLIIITALLLHPAVGLAKMSLARWAREDSGPLKAIGDAGMVVL